MDEPNAALGAKERNVVLELVRRARDHSLQVVLIGHNMPHVCEGASRSHFRRAGPSAGALNPNNNMSNSTAVMTGVKPVED